MPRASPAPPAVYSSERILQGKILSKTDVKEMIYGPYRLFTKSGNILKLTQLGVKIAAIHQNVAKG